MKRKIGISLFLLVLSCKREATEKIEVVQFAPSNIHQQNDTITLSSNFLVTISSGENFEAINPKMSFLLIAVEKRGDFALPQEELAKKHLIFEVIRLKKIQSNLYQFFVNKKLLPPGKVIYCRFERPGFVLKKGYHSPIFELKNSVTK